MICRSSARICARSGWVTVATGSVRCFRQLGSLYLPHHLVTELLVALFRQQRLHHWGVERPVTDQADLVGRDLHEFPFSQRVPHAGELLIGIDPERIVE